MADSTLWGRVAALVGKEIPAEAQDPLEEMARGLLRATFPEDKEPLALAFLCAHLWVIRDPQPSSESVGGVSVNYVVPPTREGLSATVFGQLYLHMERMYSGRMPVTVL